MTLRLGSAQKRLTGAYRRGVAAAAFLLALPCAPSGGYAQPHGVHGGLSASDKGAGGGDQQEYCANIAASSETLRLERRRKELAALETEIETKLQALEARENALRVILDRLDSFERNASEALVGLYSRMKPEAAAAQLAELDDDVGASLRLQMKSKISSAILSEMGAARGAALVKKISDLRNSSAGRKP